MSYKNPLLDATRRQFLKTTVAAGALLFSGASVLAQDSQPVRGGVLRVAFPDAPRSLDPHMALTFPELQFAMLVFDGLTRLDGDVLPLPALATSWSAEEGATQWVFELRQGVKFHNGRDFTSEDVIKTIERARDPALGLSAASYFGPIEKVVAEGPFRVRFVLTRPFAELPVQLASILARILPADGLEGIATEPVGTGPFKLQEIQPGSSLTLARNDMWWDEGMPYLDGIRFVVIREQIAQQAALRSGVVDLITRISPEGALTLKNVSDITLYSVPTGDHQALITQANKPPFDNPKVREAFKYILDRESLIMSALFGQGTLGNDMPTNAGNVYMPQIAQRTQDLEKAKRLIEESGVGPIVLDLYTSSERPPAPKLAIAFAEAASKIGVTINVKDVPYAEYAANVSRKMPLYTSQWTANATLYEMIHMKYHSTGIYNYSKTEQAPGLDKIIDEMTAELDFEKRKELARQALEAINVTSERIIPYFQNYIAATSKKVQGFVAPSFNTIDLTKVWLQA